MTGLDTNVLVRYITQDDAAQSANAVRVINALTPDAPGFISLTAITELAWVLESGYGMTRRDIAYALRRLNDSLEIRVEGAAAVRKAVNLYESRVLDIADCLIASSGAAAGCEHTLTFDRKAARIEGMRLIA